MTAATLIMVMGGAAAVDAFAEREGAWRLVDYTRLSGILLLVLVVSVRSTTNFSLMRRVPSLDDELTRANRASAATWGYWALLLALGASYIATFAFPITLQELAPGVLVTGAAFAGLRFVALERRGE